MAQRRLQALFPLVPIADDCPRHQQSPLQPFPVRIHRIGGFEVLHGQPDVLGFAKQFATAQMTHHGLRIERNGLLVVHDRFAMPVQPQKRVRHIHMRDRKFRPRLQHAQITIQRLSVLAQTHQRTATVVDAVDIRGIQLDRATQRRHCFLKCLQLYLRCAQIAPGPRIVGLQLNQLLETIHGLGRLASLAQVQTQVQPCRSVRRIAGQRLAESVDGRVVALHPALHHAQVVPGIGARRIQRDRALKAGQRLLVGLTGQVHQAQVVDDFGVVRRQLCRTTYETGCMVQVTGGGGDAADAVQRNHMVRVGAQDLLVQLLRPSEFTVVVQGDGLTQQGLKRILGKWRRCLRHGPRW